MAYLNPNEQATKEFLRQLRDEEARRLYLLRAGRGNVYTPEPIAASFPAPRTAMDLIGSGMQSDQIRSLERMGQAVTPMSSLQSDPVEVIQQSASATRPVAVRPPSPAVQYRKMTPPPQQEQGPANPATNKNSFDFGISAVPQPPTAAQGLLDTEEPAEGGSFYDDPMRMGLLQAGLGLLSAPQYSTNPNDVTLGSALARGLGGFVQGYGTTKKRLSEAERQKLEDDYQRSVRDFNQRYMQTQMDATQKRLDNDEKTTTEKVLQKEQEKTQKQAIIADILTAEPDATATRRSALNRMSLEELNAERAVYFPSAATLQQQEKERMARERLAELTGQPAETYEGQPLDKLNAEILKQFKPDKNESEFGNTELGRLLQLAVDSGRMTRDEAIEKGLEMTKSGAAPSLQYMQIDPNDPQAGTQLMMVDRNTGMMQPVPGAIQKPSRKDIPLTDVRLYNQFQLTQNQINQAIGFLSSEDALEGVGPLAGRFRPNWLTSEEGIKLRALIADLTSERLNEKFGAALTENEKAIIKNSVPFESDDEKSLRVKLNTLKELFANKMGLIQQQYPIDRFQRLPNINAVGLQGVEEAYGD
jgi:hypothetical protein